MFSHQVSGQDQQAGRRLTPAESPRPRLLYLGFAFPPGVHALHPELNPAGHRFETQLFRQLRKHFDLRTVGALPIRSWPEPIDSDPDSGVPHALTLADCAPQIVHRYWSLLRLKRAIACWGRNGWSPDAVLTYNLSPIYNAFIVDLCRKRTRPRLVLLLLDSSQLGRPMPLKKRLRYRVKPMTFLDVNMVSRFDACIGLSPEVQKYFSPSVPFLWMPGACSDRVEPANGSIPVAEDRPVRFGYFGALAEHAGIYEFTEMFLRCSTTATLHICGYGKAGARVANLAQQSSRVEFQGFLPATDDCLAFGRSCDVLVNPRPPTHGNENNFPSKVFDYALCGRAILTSGLSGVDEVLGKNAFYFEAQRFRETLPPILTELANTPVAELHRRGGLIREKVVSEYTWSLQGSRINKFIDALI